MKSTAISQMIDDLGAPNALRPDEIIKVRTTDGHDLAMGVYRPRHKEKGANDCGRTIMLVHGAGAHMLLGYNNLAGMLRDKYGYLVTTPDLRGHGQSAGRRGYTPSAQAVWEDISRLVAASQELSPRNNMHICGHSSGAGVLLNWCARRGEKEDSISSFTLLAPFLNMPKPAPLAGQKQPSRKSVRFSSARKWMFFLYFASGKRLAVKWPAVKFNFPKAKIARAGLVGSYSPEMALAVTPKNALKFLDAARIPTFIFAAEEDELFAPSSIEHLGAEMTNDNLVFKTIPGGHLSCLLYAADGIVDTINTQV